MVGCSAINSMLFWEGNTTAKESEKISDQGLEKEPKSENIDKSTDSKFDSVSNNNEEQREESDLKDIDNSEMDDQPKDGADLKQPTTPNGRQGNIQAKNHETDESNSKQGDSKRFEKFDHSAYVKKLTRLAREMVGKGDNIFYARLCKYFTTGARTLSIYKKKGSSFTYTDYWWDQIEQKWIKTNPAPPQKMKRLREHLRTASAGKDCKVLKGRIP